MAAPERGSASRAALRVADLSKTFGETVALERCSLELLPGEVHAIMGENGSGKSTLVKILAGVVQPDDGQLEVDGVPCAMRSPRDARRLGLGTVFQEVLVVPRLSVLDNLYLGRDRLFTTGGDRATRRAQAKEVLSRLLTRPIDLDTPVDALGLMERQVCVIARALLMRPRILQLDEATSALDVSVRQRLFGILRELCAEDAAVVFISHRMDEVEEIADRVTILRSGASVATLSRRDADSATMLRLMSGGRRATAARITLEAADRRGEVVLDVRDVLLRAGSALIETGVRAGEIVGLAGLEGHGQDEFLQALAGIAAPLAGSISCATDHGDMIISDTKDAESARIAYVPRERKTEGIFAPLSILDNFTVSSLDADQRKGLLWPRRAAARFRAYADAFAITFSRPLDVITALSGGNQQKVVIARWLATEPRIMLLNDPTRGVDHATKQDVYREIVAAAARGVAIVMLSTEVDEHVSLMDRVLVFREGTVSAEFDRDALERHRLVASFFGRKAAT